MCEYIFKDGEKCKEEALKGSKYCILHIPYPEDRDSEEFERIAKLKEEKVKEKIKKGDFNFEGAKLLEVDFSGIEIKSDVNFDNATILGNVLFGLNDIDSDDVSPVEADRRMFDHLKKVIVKGNIEFNSAKIGGHVLFGLSTIKGNVSFEEAKIKGSIKFNEATVYGNVSFEKAEIGENAFFGNADIKGNVVFNYIEINGFGNFLEASIKENIELSSAAIEGFLSFKRAKIGKDAWLSETTVKGKLGFEGVTIGGDAHFSFTTIKRNIWFEDAVIEKDAYFSGINTKNAWCSGVTINGNLDFDRATIEEDASFSASNIEGNVNFDRTTVKGNLWFDKATIKGDVWFDTLDMKWILSFKNALFKKPKAEENAYRAARRTYERLGDRKTAEEYFCREMRARRRQKSKITQFIELLIADATCSYGTNFFKPLWIWIISVLVVFPLVYYFGNGIVSPSPLFPLFGNPANSVKSFFSAEYFSIVTATTLGYGDLRPALTTIYHIPIFRAIAGLEAIFGTFMWVIFLTVFARKYMR